MFLYCIETSRMLLDVLDSVYEMECSDQEDNSKDYSLCGRGGKEFNFILKKQRVKFYTQNALPATISNKGLQIASVRAVAVGKKQRV